MPAHMPSMAYAIFSMACANLMLVDQEGRVAAAAAFQRRWPAVGWRQGARRTGKGRLVPAVASYRKADDGLCGPFPERDVCDGGRTTAATTSAEEVASEADREAPRLRRSKERSCVPGGRKRRGGRVHGAIPKDLDEVASGAIKCVDEVTPTAAKDIDEDVSTAGRGGGQGCVHGGRGRGLGHVHGG